MKLSLALLLSIPSYYPCLLSPSTSLNHICYIIMTTMFNVEDVVESALMDLGAFSVPAGRAGGSVTYNAPDYEAELDAANLLAEEEIRDVTNVSNKDEDTNAIIRMTETTTARLISTLCKHCLLYTSPSPRDQRGSRMPSSA